MTYWKPICKHDADFGQTVQKMMRGLEMYWRTEEQKKNERLIDGNIVQMQIRGRKKRVFDAF